MTSDLQRRQYKREFDSDLARYKSLCEEMDDVTDQMHKLNRELDTLDEGSMKYQVRKTVAFNYKDQFQGSAAVRIIDEVTTIH